ncbi:MAG: RICIN domain-containing protein [Sumerlaeia bacterium]
MMKTLATTLTAGLLSGALLAGAPLAGTSAQAETGDEIMLQGFHWNAWKGYQGQNWYNTLAGAAGDIGGAGFDIVWFPPPSKTADNVGYLPNEWYVLTSNYGNIGALQGAIGAMHGQNIFCVADIVVNHRVGTFGWADFTNPSFADNNAAVAAGDEYCCETGNWDTGEAYGAARDLDHTNWSVRNEIKNWQSWLAGNVGFDGWRYDLVKGFSGNYVKEYNDASSPYISIGEFFDYDTGAVVGWIDSTQGASRAFDFPTRNNLYLATTRGEYWRLANNGVPTGVIGAWPQKAVTFVENHDTEEARGGEYTPPFPTNKTMEGYAYILTHPGIPCVFWNDWFWDHRNAINELMAIREAQGIFDGSTVSIQQATGSVYAAIVNGNTAMKIGPGNWTPSGDWSLAASGTNYAVWTTGSGGGGGGGGGGTGCEGCPTTVTTDPASPTEGETVTVWYPSNGRPLQGSSNVNLYYGFDGWTGVQQVAMSNQGGGTFSVDITLPDPSSELNFVFNNGSSWDNNSGQDWNVAIASNGGGGGGGGGSDVYYIEARHSGKVLQVANTSTANGANVEQWSNTGSDFQKWDVVEVSGGYYRITNVGSGKSLDVSAVSTANGANVQQWDYVGGGNQEWALADVGSGYVSIRARHSNKALDVSGISTANGGNIHQWDYLSGQNQQWKLVPVQ